jgi:glycosyltransferase involved in cell wall biosynthesis
MGELRTAAVSSRGLQIDIVVPEGIDDPARPSGGNAYDRRIYRELTARGWRVREHAVSGSWPWPDGAAEDALARVVSGIRDGAVVLVDGLIASAAPNVLVPETRRLALVVLVHMPLGDGLPEPELAHARIRERAVLASASAIITTSSWTRQRLIDIYRLRSARIHVAEPGADAATLSPGTASGTELLCVAAVMPHKGHDTLFASLAIIADLSWRCVCVGPLDRDPGFVDGLRRRAETDGLADRIRFAGARSPRELDREYAAADVVVHASYAETFGMVVIEALARGLPVIATAVGGVPDALGHTADGRRPGLLVPPRDPHALSVALSSWLTDGDLRRRLRRAAQERRTSLARWSTTSDRVARVLDRLAAGSGDP